MEGMRDFLRVHLKRSLQTMSETDRLAVAWPVVCGVTMAAHGDIASYHDGIVTIIVSDEKWMNQMLSMQGQIAGELGRIAGVRVTGIHFEKNSAGIAVVRR